MSQSIVIIGSNRGIGLALVKKYLSEHWTVYAVCRQTSEELSALSKTTSTLQILSGIDVAIDTDREHLCTLLPQHVDSIIHNAGILRRDSVATASDEDILEQFTINALAPFHTLRLLKRHCPTVSKIGIITSRMGSIGDTSSAGMLGYRISKAAVNMVGKNLALEWQSPHFCLLLLHPGFVQTDMTGGQGYITTTQSAEGLYQRMQEKGPQDSGTFWHTDGSPLPW